MDNNTDWEELVDSFVDGECSEEEVRAFERELECNSKLRKDVETVKKIGSALTSLRVKAPSNFEERLQSVLATSECERRIRLRLDEEVFICEGVAKRRNGRFFRDPRFIGGLFISVAIVIVVVCGVFWNENSQDGGAVVKAQPIPNKKIEKEYKDVFSSPVSVLPSECVECCSQESFEISVRLTGPCDVDKTVDVLQKLWTKQNLGVTVSKNGLEFTVCDVDRERCKRIVQLLEQVGSYRVSNAVTEWMKSESEETKNIRVVFELDREKGDYETYGKGVNE